MINKNLSKRLMCLGILECIFLGSFTSIASTGTKDKSILTYDADWNINDKGVDLGVEWLNIDYDYSSWKKGKAPFGFGDVVSETNPEITIGTEVSFGDDDQNKHMTTYAITEVDIDTLEGFEVLEIYVHADDGAVVYFNGIEAFRKGIDEKEKISLNTPAKFSMKEETFFLPLDTLKEGKNIIAAEVHQDDCNSSDLWFEMSIRALEKAPAVIDYTTTPIPNPNVKVGKVSRVVVSFKGDVTTSKGFTWYTSQASANSNLQVIEATDEKKPNFDNAIKFSGEYKRSTNAPEFVLHKAEATGLKPNTKYQFRVGDVSLDLWSKVGSFETADDDGKFTFINLADSQAKAETEAELSAKTFRIASETVTDSKFMVLNGDIVDTGMIEDQWGWVLDASNKTLLNTTFVAATGNHEKDPESYIDHFNLNTPKGSSTEKGAYYSYNYENTHFIVLNNNEDSKQYRNFTPEQIKWLKADTKAAKANKDIDWIIAIMHKGPYTTSNHGTDADITDPNGVRELVAPLFNELGIDTFGIIKENSISNNNVKNKTATVSKLTYLVKSGDVLHRIASDFGTTYQKIQKLNNIVNPHRIYPGQKFVIPAN